MIRQVHQKRRERMFKVFKLADGMPNMATKSDALVMVEQAGYDAESIQETKKEIKTMKKEFSVVRQEVNASVVCANDSLRLLAALEKSNNLTEIDRDERRRMEKRAMVNVMIQGQRLVGVGAAVAETLAQKLGVSTIGSKLKQLITDTEPMSMLDRRELQEELVQLGKLAEAAELAKKRKREQKYGNGKGKGKGRC